MTSATYSVDPGVWTVPRLDPKLESKEQVSHEKGRPESPPGTSSS